MKSIFLVEVTVMNKAPVYGHVLMPQISSHYILVRAENEDMACEFATEVYEKKQRAVGDIITNTWAEPFEDEDDYLIVI